MISSDAPSALRFLYHSAWATGGGAAASQAAPTGHTQRAQGNRTGTTEHAAHKRGSHRVHPSTRNATRTSLGVKPRHGGHQWAEKYKPITSCASASATEDEAPAPSTRLDTEVSADGIALGARGQEGGKPG